MPHAVAALIGWFATVLVEGSVAYTPTINTLSYVVAHEVDQPTLLIPALPIIQPVKYLYEHAAYDAR